MSAWHYFMGVGILARRMWGYFLMKLYLHIMLLGFPVGTYLALRALKYLRENQIIEFFGKGVSG
jgi:hypothetical protein